MPWGTKSPAFHAPSPRPGPLPRDFWDPQGLRGPPGDSIQPGPWAVPGRSLGGPRRRRSKQMAPCLSPAILFAKNSLWTQVMNQPRLTDLPPNVIMAMIQHLDNPRNVAALARANRSARTAASNKLGQMRATVHRKAGQLGAMLEALATAMPWLASVASARWPPVGSPVGGTGLSVILNMRSGKLELGGTYGQHEMLVVRDNRSFQLQVFISRRGHDVAELDAELGEGGGLRAHLSAYLPKDDALAFKHALRAVGVTSITRGRRGFRPGAPSIA